MYRRRSRNSGSPVLQIILLGIVAGIVFIYFNNRPPENRPATTPEPAATRLLPTVTPSLEPTAQPTLAVRPKARIFIPTAGISADVIDAYLDGQSWDVRYLGRSAGHLQGTAWLDTPGNIVLAGHVEMTDGSKGIFATIGELRLGDPLVLSQGTLERQYNVIDVRTGVAPDDLSILYPAETDRLTLITCEAYNFFSDTYQSRTVVIAERVR